MFRSAYGLGAGARLRRMTKLCAAAALAVALSGCASNMTGFDFPRFGLIGHSGQDQSTLSSPEYQPTSRLGQ